MTGPEQSQAVLAARAADAAAGGGRASDGVEKLATGIPGFDHVAMGGVPKRRATVFAGTAGSAKTVFVGQFLAEGVRRGQPAVFVTLEESPTDLRRNFATLGWDVAGWEARDDWRFVDGSPQVRDDGSTEPYSFATLAAQIGHAVDATGAERVALDSLNTVLALDPEPGRARQRLRMLVESLRSSGLTVVMTVETPGDPSDSVSRLGIEEYVADNVVLLRNAREGKGRRRTLEILKLRGAAHLKGDFGFTVLPGEGVVVVPVTQAAMAPGRAKERLPSGVDGLDAMTAGGLLRDSIVLLAGPTGTGKTLLSLEFLAAGALAGQRSLLLSFEESGDQVCRNAVGRGRELAGLDDDTFRVVSTYPEDLSLEDHLLSLRQEIGTYRPERLVIDSLTALERAGSERAFRDFLVSVTALVKEQGITAVVTASTTPGGRYSSSEAHVSTLADSVVLLRYLERPGTVDRALTVLKMRGSEHDRAVRFFTIDDEGLHVGDPTEHVIGLGG